MHMTDLAWIGNRLDLFSFRFFSSFARSFPFHILIALLPFPGLLIRATCSRHWTSPSSSRAHVRSIPKIAKENSCSAVVMCIRFQWNWLSRDSTAFIKLVSIIIIWWWINVRGINVNITVYRYLTSQNTIKKVSFSIIFVLFSTPFLFSSIFSVPLRNENWGNSKRIPLSLECMAYIRPVSDGHLKSQKNLVFGHPFELFSCGYGSRIYRIFLIATDGIQRRSGASAVTLNNIVNFGSVVSLEQKHSSNIEH